MGLPWIAVVVIWFLTFAVLAPFAIIALIILVGVYAYLALVLLVVGAYVVAEKLRPQHRR